MQRCPQRPLMALSGSFASAFASSPAALDLDPIDQYFFLYAHYTSYTSYNI